MQGLICIRKSNLPSVSGIAVGFVDVPKTLFNTFLEEIHGRVVA